MSGCSRPDGRDFDGLLRSNRIDYIELVDEESAHTKALDANAAAHLLSRLAATNRVPDPLRGKSYVSGSIRLFAQTKPVGVLAYFPRERVLSYRGYEFSLRDTNDIAQMFK
jgi:hypothetical protein